MVLFVLEQGSHASQIKWCAVHPVFLCRVLYGNKRGAAPCEELIIGHLIGEAKPSGQEYTDQPPHMLFNTCLFRHVYLQYCFTRADERLNRDPTTLVEGSTELGSEAVAVDTCLVFRWARGWVPGQVGQTGVPESGTLFRPTSEPLRCMVFHSSGVVERFHPRGESE